MLEQFLCLLLIRVVPVTSDLIEEPQCVVSGNVTDCSHLNLTYIPKVSNTTAQLIFEYNILPNVTEGSFSNISRPDLMLDLSLCYNKIKILSPGSFDVFKRLRYLDLSGNNVRSEDMASFLTKTESNIHLRFLKLNSVSTNMDPDKTFSLMNGTKLETLYLMSNGIRSFSRTVLQRMDTLSLLTLDRNLIFEIELPVMNRLKQIRLNHNRLRSMPDFCLSKNGSETSVRVLTCLHLSYNQITVLSSKSFQCLPQLTELKLKGNLISLLPNDLFSYVPNIVLFDINLNTGHKARIEPRALWSQSLRSLTIGFDGSASSIFDSIEDSFKNLPVLERLSVNHVNMMNLTERALSQLFMPLTSLKYLECYNCRIVQDPSIFLNNKTLLNHLSLQANFIKTINDSTFRNKPYLKFLDLGMNKISHLKQTSLSEEFLDSLDTLDLSENPYTCDCDLVWFISWLNKKHRTNTKHFPNMYACAFPGNMARKKLTEIHFSYRQCHPFSTLEWTGMIGGPCVLVLAFVLILLYRNRWNIKHYIYLIRKRRKYVQVNGNNFTYDAFVSYNQEDSVWVREYLIPVLEEQHNLKLCIHERDFQAGVFINDNIVNCIEKSKKILVILSNSFSRSGWCMFELKVAHSKQIEDETELVVVLLEKIDGRNMNESMRVLFETTTYLEWTEDQVGQALFLNKLKDALGV